MSMRLLLSMLCLLLAATSRAAPSRELDVPAPVRWTPPALASD
jgi:hypothetical protein